MLLVRLLQSLLCWPPSKNSFILQKGTSQGQGAVPVSWLGQTLSGRLFSGARELYHTQAGGFPSFLMPHLTNRLRHDQRPSPAVVISLYARVKVA
jgi:hypothetical protein